MNKLQKFWAPIYNKFDPFHELTTPYELNKYYVDQQDSPLERMEIDLLFSQNPQKILLSGHRGNGKSSALYKLTQSIKDKFIVIILDVSKALDQHNIGYVEVLVYIGKEIYEIAKNRKIKVKQKYLTALLNNLRTFIEEEIDEKVSGLSAPKLLEDIGARLKAGFTKRLYTKLETKPWVTHTIDCINDIIQDIQTQTGKMVLVIVDGFDKLDLITAKGIFIHSSLLSKPASHLIYTISIPLRYDPDFAHVWDYFDKVEDLPNFKISTKEGKKDKGGYERLIEVINRRLEAYKTPENHILDQEAADLLITKSGGLLRDLISLVRLSCNEAVRQNAICINIDIATKAIDELCKKYLPLRNYQLEELRIVHKTKRLTDRLEDVSEDGRVKRIRICDKLLQIGHILSYFNKEIWFDVHPILLPFL
jgi:hypothetical protein